MKKPTTVLLLAAMLGAACNQPVEPQAAAPGERWTAKAASPGLTELQRRAYEELGKLHDCGFSQSTQWPVIEPFVPRDGNPMVALRDLGMDVLPLLVEALDDTTPTRTYTQRHGQVRDWRVNDLVALLIRRIADREFFIGEGGHPGELRGLIEIAEHPELIPDFQKVIQDWYAGNHGRSVEETKLADLEGNILHRLDAMNWLGRERIKEAVPIISGRIEEILGAGHVSYLEERELAEAAYSLGLIGDRLALPAVKRTCEHFSESVRRAYLPDEQGRSASGVVRWRTLFQACQGMALLGEKDRAVAGLERMLLEHGGNMKEHDRAEFTRLLEDAEKWNETH